jgi:hypothetical protein
MPASVPFVVIDGASPGELEVELQPADVTIASAAAAADEKGAMEIGGTRRMTTETMDRERGRVTLNWRHFCVPGARVSHRASASVLARVPARNFGGARP